MRLKLASTIVLASCLSSFGLVYGQTPPVPTPTTTPPGQTQTPSPQTPGTQAPGSVQTQTPVPPTAAGLRHEIQALRRDGSGPAPDGATIFLSRLISPQERRQIEQTGRGPGGCAQVNVSASRAVVVPQFTQDCPEGTNIGAVIDFHDGQPPITAQLIPAIEWRSARGGESSRAVVLRPYPPPSSGGGEVSSIQPPATGDASLTSDNGSNEKAYYIAAVAAFCLAGAALALRAVMDRARK